MELKKILLLVDNRQASSPDLNDPKPNPSIDFRGSAFKGTNILNQLPKLMLQSNCRTTVGKSAWYSANYRKE